MAQMRAVPDGTVILPAAAVAAIAETGSLNDTGQTIVALWRAPERFAGARTWEGQSVFVDVASFGETGLIAVRRGGDGLPAQIPLGPVGSPARASGAPIAIETSRTPAGTLALRGRMVPTHSVQAPTDQSIPGNGSIPALLASPDDMPKPWSSRLHRPERFPSEAIVSARAGSMPQLRRPTQRRPLWPCPTPISASASPAPRLITRTCGLDCRRRAPIRC